MSESRQERLHDLIEERKPYIRTSINDLGPGQHELPDIVRTAARLDPGYSTQPTHMSERIAIILAGGDRERYVTRRELRYLTPEQATIVMRDLLAEGFVTMYTMGSEADYSQDYGRSRDHEDGMWYERQLM